MISTTYTGKSSLKKTWEFKTVSSCDSNNRILLNPPVIHLNTPVIYLNSPVIHLNTPVKHLNSPVIHLNAPVIHFNLPVIHLSGSFLHLLLTTDTWLCSTSLSSSSLPMLRLNGDDPISTQSLHGNTYLSPVLVSVTETW